MGNLVNNLNQKSILLGLISLGFGTAAISNYRSLKKINKKIKFIEEAKEYSPSECIEELNQKMN